MPESDRPVIGTGDPPIRAWIEYHGIALLLFSAREENAILAESAEQMGNAWIANFLPKRFTNYAKLLGYRVSAKYAKRKARLMVNPMPLIGPPQLTTFQKRNRKTGQTETLNRTTLLDAADKARAIGKAKGGNCSVTIKIPTGHAIKPIVKKVLGSIPENEINSIAKTFGETLTALLNGANHSDPARSKLSDIQRGTLKVGRKSPATGAKRKKVA